MEAEKDNKQRGEGTYSEKRRYPRLDIHLPIECEQIKSCITHTGNISEGGVLMYFAEQMTIGQYLRLKLFFSLDAELDTIKALAEVVWMDHHLSKDIENHYPYGIKFVDISPEDRTKLRSFISRLSYPSENESQNVDAN
jgi:c-di-GMP-binding flagellar brake protein YcgR